MRRPAVLASLLNRDPLAHQLQGTPGAGSHRISRRVRGDDGAGAIPRAWASYVFSRMAPCMQVERGRRATASR